MTDRNDDQDDIYEQQLDPELRDVYRQASPSPEVGREIRLQRTLLSALAPSMATRGNHITAAQAVLIRLILLAMKQETGPSNLEELLQDMGEGRLQAAEDEQAAEEAADKGEPEGEEE